MKCFEFVVDAAGDYPEPPPVDQLQVVIEEEIIRPEDNPEIVREC